MWIFSYCIFLQEQQSISLFELARSDGYISFFMLLQGNLSELIIFEKYTQKSIILGKIPL